MKFETNQGAKLPGIEGEAQAEGDDVRDTGVPVSERNNS